QSYRRAMELTANAAERAFLEQRLAEVSRAAGAEPAPG
ncbi:MAG: RNA polymerase ECF-type sigma factor, partial [uncultured Thermomicrobiales bacterium]